MQTYDASAVRRLEAINAQYQEKVDPFFSRGMAHVERHREEAAHLDALRHQLRFEFEIAALQAIENTEHLASLLDRPMFEIAASSQISFSNELPFFSIWGSERRLPDILMQPSTGHAPFQKDDSRSIVHLKFTPTHNGDKSTFAKTGVPCDAQIATCLLTIDMGNDGSHICIERDSLSELGIGPTGLFEMFYDATSKSFEERLTAFPKPHMWYQHRNFHAMENGPHEEIRKEGGWLPYRPRSIDIASVVNYDGINQGQILTLPDLLQKFNGMGKVGFGTNPHPAITKDMLTILFDAARVELFDEKGLPKSEAAQKTAEKLYLLTPTLEG